MARIPKLTMTLAYDRYMAGQRLVSSVDRDWRYRVLRSYLESRRASRTQPRRTPGKRRHARERPVVRAARADLMPLTFDQRRAAVDLAPSERGLLDNVAQLMGFDAARTAGAARDPASDRLHPRQSRRRSGDHRTDRTGRAKHFSFCSGVSLRNGRDAACLPIAPRCVPVATQSRNGEPFSSRIHAPAKCALPCAACKLRTFVATRSANWHGRLRKALRHGRPGAIMRGLTGLTAVPAIVPVESLHGMTESKRFSTSHAR